MRLFVSFIIVLSVLLTSCRVNDRMVSGTSTGVPTVSVFATAVMEQPTRKLVVFAAASLTGVFKEIGKAFEAMNPGTEVQLSFAGSQILRTQLEQGAYADVFASADHKNMDALVNEDFIQPSAIQDFSSNRMTVVLPTGNPANVQALVDLSKPGVKLVLADSSVPAGAYARQILDKMSQNPIYGAEFSRQVLFNLVSNEMDVKLVMTKIELGEADAGIVYQTDAAASPDLLSFSIPDEFNIVVKYPIAQLKETTQPALATEFINYLVSPAGQAILSRWGFTP